MGKCSGRNSAIYFMGYSYYTWLTSLPPSLEDTSMIRPAIELMIQQHKEDMEREVTSEFALGWDRGYLEALRTVLDLINLEDEFMLKDLAKTHD